MTAAAQLSLLDAPPAAPATVSRAIDRPAGFPFLSPDRVDYRSTRAFARCVMDEYVSAVSSERSCRCQGNAKLKRARAAGDETSAAEVEQLQGEAHDMLARGRFHQSRVDALFEIIVSEMRLFRTG